MRLNKYIALHSEYSRRSADKLIENGHVRINGQPVTVGQTVSETDEVYLHNQKISDSPKLMTVLFNKPTGYVCSRDGQGSQTIYDILPVEYRRLNPVGRLDKESSGLLLLTNDGDLANELTHPRYQKIKKYHVSLDKPLTPLHQQMINDHGLNLKDGLSKLGLQKLDDQGIEFEITMHEGRNRQIRRTFAALNYRVMKLERIQFGSYTLSQLCGKKTMRLGIVEKIEQSR